ncbi:MAG: transporter substrate-binding domain-containing protein [Treponema sp.]|nr:transporter substrate-binding domain-containing protein [Treponema sp.]
MKKIVIKITAILSILFAFSSCNKKSSKDITRKVTVALNQAYVPYAYVDENGKITGYEYDVLREVEKLLPKYKFTYVSTSQEDALLGLETGRNDIVLSGMFKNPVRAEKYGIPKNPECATVTGFFVNAAYKDKLKGWNKESGYSDIVENNLRLGPVNSATGLYGIVLEYNEKNPDKQLQFTTVTQNIPNTEMFAWVLDGRYDAFIFNEPSFWLTYNSDANITPNGVPNPTYKDKLVFVPTYSIGVWPLFNKNDTELIEDYNKAFEELYKNGTIAKIQDKYFSKDVLSLLREHEKVRF